MRRFDSNVQVVKNEVLREVAKHLWEGTQIFSVFDDIASVIIKEDAPLRSCCIYKDRAKLAERIRIALGGNRSNDNVIEVISLICDECPEAGHVVTDLCRGCLAHACEGACRLGAITYTPENRAKIDKSKCVECGQCAKACPYTAIHNFKRPCETACVPGAIHMAKTGEAVITEEKCTQCGACVSRCPFGAAVDKSFISDVIRMILESDNNQKYKVVAILAPAIASQCPPATYGQTITALHQLGFAEVHEAAYGADIVAYEESIEIEEKGELLSSCCPAFVSYVEQKHPNLANKMSDMPSPMVVTGKLIKEKYPSAKVVFIGPCTAKKAEIKKTTAAPYVDSVLTFEELAALFDSRDIIVEDLEETTLDEATGYGRRFAHSGGVIGALQQALEERGRDFQVNAVSATGIAQIRTTLLKASKGVLSENYIEGMACDGGCISGAGCLRKIDKNANRTDEHAAEATHMSIKENVEHIAI